MLTPVFYGIQDFDPRSGAPGPLRVFYPTIDGAVYDALLLRNCGRYPLVVFLHGHCPQAMEHYRAWVHLPVQLARSGYVIVVPQLPGISAGPPPFAEVSTDLTLVEKVLAWVRQEWAYRDQLMLPRCDSGGEAPRLGTCQVPSARNVPPRSTSLRYPASLRGLDS